MKSISKTASYALAAALLAGTLAGCQTAGIDPSTTASFQGSRSDKKVFLAARHFESGNYGLAEKNYRLAVEAAPENGAAWLGLAAAYDQLGRFDLSDRAYSQLYKLEGRRASILNNQGYSFILRGDLAKARTTLSEAKILAPGNVIIEGNWQLAVAG